MSLDEKLFGFLYAATKRAFRRAKPDNQAALTGLAVSDRLDDLGIVACAIAEQRVELGVVPDAGSIESPRIGLPARIDLGAGERADADCLLVRVAFDASVVRLGFALDRPAAGRNEALLASALIVPRVREHLASELPGVGAPFARACELILSKRALLSTLDAPSAALEALLQQRLGRPVDAANLPLSVVARAWLSRALAARVTAPGELKVWLQELLPFTHDAQVAPPVLWGGLGAPSRSASPLAAAAPATTRRQQVQTEKRARPQQALERVDLSTQPEAENPLTHSFEKLHTLDDYRGGNKRADGSDELDEHADALDELELRVITRSGESAASLLRSDQIIDGSAAEAPEHAPAGALAIYDEWNERSQSYRPNWCHVYAAQLAETCSAEDSRRRVRSILTAQRGELRALSAELARLRSARRWRTRQPDGPDVDIDALIERHASLRSGHDPSTKLYLSRRRQRRELAVMLLVDRSLSTDAWVEGRRVLDVAKSALIMLGELFDEEEVPTAIGAFSSQTRKRCQFGVVKEFEDPWQAAQARLLSLEPEGYTRIGPALRHASTLLAKHEARNKLLLLISDGKPTDYDRYEGRYGMSDVRKALIEAEQLGISTFALAIESRPLAHLPIMFGRGHFELLPRPEGLARALTGVYADMMR
jgi:nitric oxide reductase activation protein